MPRRSPRASPAGTGVVEEVGIDLCPPRAGDAGLSGKAPERGKERVPAAPRGPGTLRHCGEKKIAFPCFFYDVGEDRFVVLAGDPECAVDEQEGACRAGWPRSVR